MTKTMSKSLVAKPGRPPFEIFINSLGITLTDELRAAATRKIGRVRQYAPDALSAIVDVQKTAAKRSSEQFRVFVRYELPGADVTAEHRAHEPLTALDLVAEKIERRLRKRKTALLASRLGRHGKPVRIADFCLPPDSLMSQNVVRGAAL